MPARNPYYHRSRIPVKKFRLLARHFASDLTAAEVADLTGLTRKTVTTVFLKIRERIADECERTPPPVDDWAIVNARYYGPHYAGKTRGVCAGSGVRVFELVGRSGRLYTEVVSDGGVPRPEAGGRGRAVTRRVAHPGGRHILDGLIGMALSSQFPTPRVEGGESVGSRHVHTLYEFWWFVSHRLRKFHGVTEGKFHLHLKECEYRFNLRDEDLYSELLGLLRRHPL